ncbi:MAG: carboxylating nicotinate-nucleotide diphosphorylase [Bacteroidales bacterium]|nr:carboxylating nicotinate-nucleotide diphosphorylase [Bacteroidales bacterium]
MPNKLIEELIDLAIREDIGDGDHTSFACIPKSARGKAHLLVKEEGLIAGCDIAEIVFKKIDPDIEFDKKIENGTRVFPGNIVFYVSGKVHSLLQAERLVLNIMQRMSGIATQTNKYAEKLKGLKTKVLDTRKTTPGMRLLDKQAVKTGGGENHRIGLYDMILIKDNHIDFAGSIENAIARTKKYLADNNKDLKIEIEARSIDDIITILKTGGIDRIMLDNFTIKETKTAVELIDGRFETESSGGISLEALRDYAECGVDYISVGALTHQIKSIDLSLKAIDF